MIPTVDRYLISEYFILYVLHVNILTNIHITVFYS
ncbi:hypothetical protein EV201_0019 [Ancylomarina subtilis]|uniref:Uncharacterized protein n=1 Tax=Ancylomarina subtilis TaxID=1639035 RepID=A0A4Q7VH49_9BACT|nr:hypothetical protein EV201_0019 [Ancylomarina subtilis]